FYLTVARLALAAVHEQLRHLLDGSLSPVADLHGVHVVLRSQLVQRPLAADRLQRHPRLELRTVLLSCRRHRPLLSRPPTPKLTYCVVQILGTIIAFDGSEKLFAVDGQHRVVGIQRAVAAKEALGDEEVCVIFVGHSNDRVGLQRTRRLFTTLNRYAKPVNKTEIIALDEDAAVAIVTRRLLESYRLLKDFTSIKRGKSI